MSESSVKFPKRVVVGELISSRYPSGKRPLEWEKRIEGVDSIKDDSGTTIKLLSDGMQSPPQQGWTLMLTAGNASDGFHWTLYGMSRIAASAS